MTAAALEAVTTESLAALTDDDFASLFELVRNEDRHRLDRQLITAIAAALAADEAMEITQEIGDIVKVVFHTWEWDDGWCFQESDACLHDRHGNTHQYDFSSSESVQDLLATASSQHAIGQHATLTIHLTYGAAEVDTYGDS